MDQNLRAMDQEVATPAETPFEDTTVDVMAARPLHRIMVLLDKPAEWSNLTSGLVMLMLAALSSAVWWMITIQESALMVGGLMLLFFLGDLAVLLMLPRRRISFGDWQPQFFQLAGLRTAAALGIGLVTLFAGWPLGLGILLTVQLVGTAALIWGAVVEPSQVQTTELEILCDRMKRDSEPVRFLHITDLHIEYISRREDDVLQAVEELKPDFIVITGDYVNLSFNEDPKAYGRIQEYLSKISAPLGVYATLGTPTVDLREYELPMFDELEIKLLRGERQTVTMADGQRIALLGLDCTHHIQPDAAVMNGLVAQGPNDEPQILLYHSPELMPQARDAGIDLYLCGHTHGGQVRLPLIGPLLTSSQLGRRYVMGLYHEQRTHLYVSRGVGLEGLSAPRVRFMARPEITLVTIQPRN